MKVKIFALIACSLLILTVGTSVAYYNTKTFGFDEDATIISKDDEKISFLDFNLYFKDIEDFFEKAKVIVPSQSRTIQYNVA